MKITLNQPYSFCQLGRRDNQEDARFPDEDKPQDCKPFFVVCDGVGGEKGGEVASRTVCNAFASCLAQTDWDRDFTNEDFKRCLNAAYSALDKKRSANNEGMATTMTFMAFHAGGCTVAHIGDSRVYHVRPGSGILYRSDDHSLVNALVHSGAITPDEAIGHSQENIITRCMEANIDKNERPGATVLRITDIRQGDYFVLCTDGVMHQISDDKLVKELSDSDVSDENRCRTLASMCKKSVDNNTLYLVSVKNVDADEPLESIDLDGSDDLETVRIKRTSNIVSEIAADKDTSIMNKMRSLIKRIF